MDKHFKEKMFIRSQFYTSFEVFFKLILNSEVFFRSVMYDIFRRKWVKLR